MRLIRIALWLGALVLVVSGICGKAIAHGHMNPNSVYIDGRGYVEPGSFRQTHKARGSRRVHGKHAHVRKHKVHHPRRHVRRTRGTPVKAVLQKVVSAPQAVIHTVEKVITAVAPQQDKFDKLRKSIAELWASMKLSPRKEDEVRRTAKMLLDPWKMEQYRQVEAETGVPALLIAVIHYRESNADFSKSLANGDPWNKRYRRVPKGRGPFASWKDAAIDALRIDELDKVGRENWSMERALFFAEAYNGWGYRYRGLPSAYVWAASSAYRGSKFVGDGRFRRNAWDDQLGVAPLMAEMISLDPTLVIPVEVAKIPADHPAARGYSVYAALQLQP